MPEEGKIFEIIDLFEECFQQKEACEFFVERLIATHPRENLHTIENDLLALDPAELVRFVIHGSIPSIPGFIMPPTPNILFTRDIAAVIGESILLSHPARKARLRESLLMEALIEFHPLFSGIKEKVIKINGQESIEGGDVLVASEKVALIGMSERTSFSGLMSATKGLLKNGLERVLAVDIPKQRSSMHLDTIFTFASDDECIVFPPAITERRNNVISLSSQNGSVITESMPSLKEALEEFLDRKMNFINCGGDDRTNQFREQWTDGANVFALAPGIIAGYERNTNTFRELQDYGYRLMNQFEFVEEFENKSLDSAGKIAISFLGNELCRGRGGARCMTMPIARATN
jgi:arginine deiminase